MATYPTNGLSLDQANAIIAAARAKGRELGLLPVPRVEVGEAGAVWAIEADPRRSELDAANPTRRRGSFMFVWWGESGRGELRPRGQSNRMDTNGRESNSKLRQRVVGAVGRLQVNRSEAERMPNLRRTPCTSGPSVVRKRWGGDLALAPEVL